MHSVWSRLNTVFFYGMTALLALCVANALTTIWMEPSANVTTIGLRNLEKFDFMREKLKNGRQLPMDRAVFSFDLDADLTGVFNWNVHQLFAYVVASYESESKTRNEVVVWDSVVANTTVARLRCNPCMVKYPLIAQSTDLRNRTLSLSLHWDVMPISGKLYSSRQGVSTIRLPGDYCPKGCGFEKLST